MNTTANARIKEILSKHTKVSPEDMTDELPLENTEIDSLGMMEVMFDLEDAFDIEIPEPATIEEREHQFRTVGDVVKHIETIINQNQQVA